MTNSVKRAAVLLSAASLFCAVALAAPQKPVTIKADVINYDSVSGMGTAEGHVVLIQEDGEAKGEKAEYNFKTDQGWLLGNVIAQKGASTLKADKIWIFSRIHMAAEGKATLTKAGDSIAAERLDYWSDREFAETSGSSAKLTQADGSVVTAAYMNYDMKAGVAKAIRNVEVNSPPRKLTAAGDNAVYNVGTKEKPGDVILTGNAWAIQDGNKIVGDVLTIKSDSSESAAKGNVKMVIIPKDEPPKGGPPPEKKQPEDKKASGEEPGAGKGDKKPEDVKKPDGEKNFDEMPQEKPSEPPVWEPPEFPN